LQLGDDTTPDPVQGDAGRSRRCRTVCHADFTYDIADAVIKPRWDSTSPNFQYRALTRAH